MKKAIGTILSLTLIASVCALVLATVDSATKDRIASAKERASLAAASAVMPSGTVETKRASATSGDGRTIDVYTGYGADGTVTGYAVAGRDGGGYGGDIELMVGFEKDAATVVCYKKLAASETPGLGSKLSTPEFAGQFAGKKAADLKVKKDGGEIEAITAATITSRAVCRAVGDARKSLAAVLSYAK